MHNFSWNHSCSAIGNSANSMWKPRQTDKQATMLLEPVPFGVQIGILNTLLRSINGKTKAKRPSD